MIRISIITNEQSVMLALKVLLKFEKQIQLITTKANIPEAIAQTKKLKPDIAFIDLPALQSGKIDIIQSICCNSSVKVILYKGAFSPAFPQAIAAGARGYLLYSSPAEVVVTAIQSVVRGNIYLTEEALEHFQFHLNDAHRLKIKRLNLWLVKKVIQSWQSSVAIEAKEPEVLKKLGFDLHGLSWMKRYLCQQRGAENKNLTLTEEINNEISGIFTQIRNSVLPKEKLKTQRQAILNILNEENTNGYCYLHALETNFQSLRTEFLDRLQEITLSLTAASPLPQQFFLVSIKEQLRNFQTLLEEDFQNHQKKQQSALRSFNIMMLKPQEEIDVQTVCQQAASVAYQARINADLCSLIEQLIKEIIGRLEMHIVNLEKTNALLNESISNLGLFNSIEESLHAPFFDELKKLISIEDLQNALVNKFAFPLELWGISKSVTDSEIRAWLTDALELPAYRLYSNLYREFFDLPLVKNHTHQTSSSAEQCSGYYNSNQQSFTREDYSGRIVHDFSEASTNANAITADLWLE